MRQTGSAPGKIILSGEYAVVFGHAGIAVPSSIGMEVSFEEDLKREKYNIRWEGTHGGASWLSYAEKIVGFCEKKRDKFRGEMHIRCELPLGKGMGASTALVIAIARALLGEDSREEAEAIEKQLNPKGSGIDFSVIWHGRPLQFRRNHPPMPALLSPSLLANTVLIDTGAPGETTTELVTWVESRREDLEDALRTIGACTERLLQGEPLARVLPDHHRAQVTLGVVPQGVQAFISAIEEAGGAAKVIGAGARTGGGGIVLATGNREGIAEIASAFGFEMLQEQG